MSLAQLQASPFAPGCTAYLSIEGNKGKPCLKVSCKVLDVRLVWGKTQYQVEPALGSGSMWVEDYRLTK